MGGRGAEFRPDRQKGVLDEIGHKKKDVTYFIDYGDINKESRSKMQNNLTNKLEDNKIILGSSVDNMESSVREMTVIQVNDLAEKYSRIIHGYLNDENLMLRSYAMDRVSIKSGKRSPEYQTGALFSSNTNEICLNLRTNTSLSQIRETIKANQARGDLVQTDIRNVEKHIVTHEFGHFIENCLIEKRLQQDIKKYKEYKEAKNNGEWSKFLSIQESKAREIVNEIWSIAQDKYHETNVKNFYPSKYSKTDAFEWFAEMFAETNLHTTNKTCVRAMQEFLDKEGEI